MDKTIFVSLDSTFRLEYTFQAKNLNQGIKEYLSFESVKNYVTKLQLHKKYRRDNTDIILYAWDTLKRIKYFYKLTNLNKFPELIRSYELGEWKSPEYRYYFQPVTQDK